VPAPACAWTWPVDGSVVRGFSFDPSHPYAAGQHRGIDIAASEGTPVRAPAAGTVTFAGTVPSGGKTISIETPLGYTATLLHLGSVVVARDAHVGEGARVGTAGGDSFVYFGVRATANPQGYVDPLGFLPLRPDPASTVDGGATSPPQAAQPTHTVASASAPSSSARGCRRRPLAREPGR
jgi:murein DD-endopeptidase MepM/ murein hydrolase activator NlpD